MISVYGSDIEDFLDNKHFQYACAFATSQIGERVKRLSLELTSGHSEVDWKVIARFRDLLSHGYESVNLRVFWDTTINDIPKLRKECELILTELRRNDKN